MNKTNTKNLHLPHPEDEVLTGNLKCLDWFHEPNSTISTKMDGSPALVYGTNPANGKWFCGTKSVFNKIKIKIAHSHEEIDQFYTGKVAEILHLCFDYLPRTKSIIQCDWIGVGGSQEYKPNTITYRFPQVVKEKIIVAPHTTYGGGDDLRDVFAAPLCSKLISTKHCKFIQPHVELNPYREDLEDVCKFAKQMSTMCEFVTPNKATQIKKEINNFLREGNSIQEDEIAEKCDCDVNLLRLHKLVKSIKDDLFLFIHEMDEIECYINGEQSFHEGFVIHNKFGTYKVVDREVFSRMNFILPKNWE